MSREVLLQSIDRILEGSLGLDIRPAKLQIDWPVSAPVPESSSPFKDGVVVGLTYAAAFGGLPWLIYLIGFGHVGQPSAPMFWLQLYGAFWAAWATTSTRITSASVRKAIAEQIVPGLSPATSALIEGRLSRRFHRRRILLRSWTIAVIGAGISAMLISLDTASLNGAVRPSIVELIWWFLGWSVLFATSAKVVFVATFYLEISKGLESDAGELYMLDPARSSSVIAVTNLGRSILIFWTGIALSIALVVPFAVKDWGLLYDLARSDITNRYFYDVTQRLFYFDISNNRFIVAEILVTGFFSIGVGTIIFLRSEIAIRRAVRKASVLGLREIESRLSSFSQRIGDLNEEESQSFGELSAAHRTISSAESSYRGIIISAASVIVPLLPLISLLLGGRR